MLVVEFELRHHSWAGLPQMLYRGGQHENPGGVDTVKILQQQLQKQQQQQQQQQKQPPTYVVPWWTA